jgi:hypothetical protein
MAWFAAVLWLALALPPLRGALDSSMTLQMLLQPPLLALAGWWLRPLLSGRVVGALSKWNRSGVSGLLLASFATMVWMLPRTMDAVLDTPWIGTTKFVGIPLLVGLPLAISWPRAGFVVRGVFLLEAIATAFRLGWLYLVSPQRLCSNFLLYDQRRLGELLLAIGALISLALAWKLMWGRFDAVGEPQSRR